MSEHGMATEDRDHWVMFSGMDVCAAGARVRQESSVCGLSGSVYGKRVTGRGMLIEERVTWVAKAARLMHVLGE